MPAEVIAALIVKAAVPGDVGGQHLGLAGEIVDRVWAARSTGSFPLRRPEVRIDVAGDV